jgi:hypothetical protein
MCTTKPGPGCSCCALARRIRRNYFAHERTPPRPSSLAACVSVGMSPPEKREPSAANAKEYTTPEPSASPVLVQESAHANKQQNANLISTNHQHLLNIYGIITCWESINIPPGQHGDTTRVADMFSHILSRSRSRGCNRPPHTKGTTARARMMFGHTRSHMDIEILRRCCSEDREVYVCVCVCCVFAGGHCFDPHGKAPMAMTLVHTCYDAVHGDGVRRRARLERVAVLLAHELERAPNVPDDTSKQCGISLLSSKQCGISLLSSKQCGISLLSSKQCGISLLSSKQCGISLLSSMRLHTLVPTDMTYFSSCM